MCFSRQYGGSVASYLVCLGRIPKPVGCLDKIVQDACFPFLVAPFSEGSERIYKQLATTQGISRFD
jgi:hypothetical protein